MYNFVQKYFAQIVHFCIDNNKGKNKMQIFTKNCIYFSFYFVLLVVHYSGMEFVKKNSSD